jgi:hypothetical protein
VPYQGTLKTPVSSPPPKTDKGRTHNHGQKPEAASKRVNGGESAEADLVEDKDADADVAEEIERQHNSFDHGNPTTLAQLLHRTVIDPAPFSRLSSNVDSCSKTSMSNESGGNPSPAQEPSSSLVRAHLRRDPDGGGSSCSNRTLFHPSSWLKL